MEVLLSEWCDEWKSDYSQIAEENAQGLTNEEEQAKLKAEKKRAKKMRQKEKKKYNEDGCVNKDDKIKYSLNTISNDKENVVLNTDNNEDERIDINAAFVSKAVKKLKNISQKPAHQKKNQAPTNKNKMDKNSLVKTAQEYENKKHHREAIQYLSNAIHISPQSCDLILKRSFVYYQLAKYKKSTLDAEKVLKLDPNNNEGYYRLGEGHFAMNNLFEAEAAFTKLIPFDAYTEEASERLFSIRLKRLQRMGYRRNEAFTALFKSKNKTLNEAIEFLTALENGKVETDDLYYSDEEESDQDYDQDKNYIEDNDAARGPLTKSAPKPNIIIDKKNPLFTDPSNPTKCCSLFVGNLKKDIKFKEIQDLFIKFGKMENITLSTTYSRCYAFVNYKESSSAGSAMKALQGSRGLLSTLPLIIRYTDKATVASISNLKNPELVLSKLTADKSTRKPRPAHKPSGITSSVKGPTGDSLASRNVGTVKKRVLGKPPC